MRHGLTIWTHHLVPCITSASAETDIGHAARHTPCLTLPDGVSPDPLPFPHNVCGGGKAPKTKHTFI